MIYSKGERLILKAEYENTYTNETWVPGVGDGSAALGWDLGLIPSLIGQFTGICNCSSRGSDMTLWHQAHTRCIDKHKGNTHIKFLKTSMTFKFQKEH